MSDDNSKSFLSIDEIAAIDDVKYAEVSAWGGIVRLGSLSAFDMLEFVESNEGPARKTAGVRLIVKSIVDKDGNRIGEPKHAAVFQKKDASTIAMLVNKIMELNGLKPGETKNESSEVATVASPTVLH